MSRNLRLEIISLIALALFVISTGLGMCSTDFSSLFRNAAVDERFVATLSGTSVDFDWSAMVAADSYTMAVTLSDVNGDVDMGSLALLGMGSQKAFSTSGLPSGTIFYAAILAHTDQGQVVSNTVKFMPFAGTCSFPLEGGVLMLVDDLGGIGKITVSGYLNADAETFSINRIEGDAGAGPFVLTVFDNRPETYTKGDLTMYFTYAADGTVMLQCERMSQRLSEYNPSDDWDWDYLNDCQKSLRWDIYDLQEDYYGELKEMLIISIMLGQMAQRALDQFTRAETFGSEVEAEHYYELYSTLKGLKKIYLYAAQGAREKFKEDKERLEEMYDACPVDPDMVDITAGSWSIVNNHTLGDFLWYHFIFIGTPEGGRIRVVENDSAKGTYEVAGSQVSIKFDLINASGYETTEEYEGTIVDVDTMQGTWRKKGTEDTEWVTGNWTGTRQ